MDRHVVQLKSEPIPGWHHTHCLPLRPHSLDKWVTPDPLEFSGTHCEQFSSTFLLKLLVHVLSWILQLYKRVWFCQFVLSYRTFSVFTIWWSGFDPWRNLSGHLCAWPWSIMAIKGERGRGRQRERGIGRSWVQAGGQVSSAASVHLGQPSFPRKESGGLRVLIG